jgi:hypothetical protein
MIHDIELKLKTKLVIIRRERTRSGDGVPLVKRPADEVRCITDVKAAGESRKQKSWGRCVNWEEEVSVKSQSWSRKAEYTQMHTKGSNTISVHE